MSHFSRKPLALVLTGFCLLAVGCWKPSAKDDPNNGKSEEEATASFYVVKVDGQAVTPKSEGKIWKFSDHKEIFVRACLIDRKASQRILGHRFSVEIPEENKRLRDLDPTDPDGCFQWKESIPYNPLAEKTTYIEVRRRIHGEGVHVGFRDIRLAINPWSGERSDKLPAVVYLKTGQVSPSQLVPMEQRAKALSGNLGNKARLWMDDISTQLTLVDESDASLRLERDRLEERKVAKGERDRKGSSDEQGALLEMLLSMRPKVRVEGMDGNPEFIDLKAGQFNIWVQLIATNVGEKRDQTLLLTPTLIPGEGKIFGSRLETSVKMGLSRRVTRGRLEMAIKVVPVGLGSEVVPFEALYTVGDIENILSPRPFLSPKFTSSPENFKYDSYIESADNFKELQSAQLARRFDPFIFETASVQFAGIRPGETATTRTVEYKVTSCVRDTLTGRRVQFEKFQIFDDQGKEILDKRPDGSRAPLTTNQDGCLIWTSSLTHKYYKPEEFAFPKFKIVHRRMGEGGSITKELVMNPWDAMFRTFGFDRVEFSQEFIDSVKNRTKIASRLFVPRFSYHALRFRYEIDRFMELEVKKLILLNLRPEVLRYSGIIGGRKVTEPLRDGIYLMKVALQKDYLDPADKGNFLMPGRDRKGDATTILKTSRRPTPKHFVTVVKKLVRVNGGEINTPVEFTVQDLRLMRIRSQFLVQLETVDEQALHAAMIISSRYREQLKDLEKTRELTDNERRAIMAEQRSKLEQNLSKLKSKLASVQGGLINPDRIAQLSDEELKEFDLTKEMGEDLQKALKVNDFTVSDAAPVVGLDKLVEKDSGLERRTFVGPVIFLSNAYSDDLRPTDILQLDDGRCETSDCDELKAREIEGRQFRNNYDRSKFFGSVAHLAGIQVDDLIGDYLLDREDYKRMMPAISSLANYANLFNLQLVMLNNETFAKVDWSCSGSVESCSKPAPELQYNPSRLLEAFNSPKGEFAGLSQTRRVFLESIVPSAYWPKLGILRDVTIDDLKNLAKGSSAATGGGKSQPAVSVALGDRLCQLFAVNVSRSFKANDSLAEMLRKDTYRQCLRPLVTSEGKALPFTLDYKVRVFGTGEYVFMGGKQMNFNVGSNFNMNHSYDFKVSTGVGVNLADFIPLFFGKPASGKDWSKPLSLKVGADMGASRSISDGTGISESTYLVMQSANFAIQLMEYERCTVVKLAPQLLNWLGRSAVSMAKTDAERDEIIKGVHKGLMVCAGEHERKPWPVNESYYYFTQHFTEGDMLDQADLYNHPWLLAMRGVRDFAAFVHLVRLQEANLFQPFTKVAEKPGWALDHLVDAYRNVIPTFPGLYTILKPGEGIKEYPFDQSPEEAFVR